MKTLWNTCNRNKPEELICVVKKKKRRITPERMQFGKGSVYIEMMFRRGIYLWEREIIQ